MRVHSDRFCWKRSQAAGVLVAKLEMGDFLSLKTVKLKVNSLDKTTKTNKQTNKQTSVTMRADSSYGVV